jgi:hypothetical protein
MSGRRELFAAAALQGLLAGRNPAAQAWSTLEVARVAVECADYVISVLDQTGEPVPSGPAPAPVPEPTLPVQPDDVDSGYLSLIK